MNKATKITMYALLGLNALAGITLTMQTARLINTIKSSVVYDIDKVRVTFVEETQFMYFEGCRMGTEYVHTEPPTGFNPNSPTNYCNNKRKSWEPWILERSMQLGRMY